MRALPWVLTLAVLLAGATAHGAEAVKIRASWIVAPSDWTPLLPEKPELMKNNGKSYVFEPMRFQGTPAVITALANNEIELGNLAFSSLALAIENAGLEDLRIVGDQFKDGTEGHYSNQILRAQGQPDPEGRGSQRQDRRDQRGWQRRRHRHARHAAQARARGQARLYRGGGAVPDHEGHAHPEKGRSRLLRGAVLVRSRTQADRAAAVQPARRARGHADDRVGRADGLPAEEPRRHGRFLGGFRAGRALVPRSQESRRGRADRGEGHQTAPGTVRGLALHQQGIFAQPGSAARSGGAAVQHRRAARPRLPQATDRRADIRRSEHRAGGGAAAEMIRSPLSDLAESAPDAGQFIRPLAPSRAWP